MSEPKRKRLVRKRKLEKWSGRGEIYAWLRAHHKKIKSLKVGDDRPWSELLLDLRMDLAGIIPAERIALNNVLNTWKRVWPRPWRLATRLPVQELPFKNSQGLEAGGFFVAGSGAGGGWPTDISEPLARVQPPFARPHPRIRSPAGN